ncbi:hypothetical protein CCS01_19530 [Rhodopila globiformis]|uniref:Mutator family transposase n=1 Tax=Rhodopila globiformis TaxID=1071 RepID=A0A2S6N6V5_RHOGL|nr:hypothetical protein CCS01_19530 [Rhodopila globiformis]
MRIDNELRNRGVNDILIAVVDGLKGFPKAINAAFLQTLAQTCIVHLIRTSLAYVSWQDRREVVAALKPIYVAPTVEAALQALEAFETGPWGRKYPAIAPAWRRQWQQVVPFFAFPPEVRRIIDTPTPSRASTASCVPQSAAGGTSPPTRRQRNCCIWSCAMSAKTGRCSA